MSNISNDAETLLSLAEGAKLFRTHWGASYADIKVDNHTETWPINSVDFRRWLELLFFKSEHRAIPNASLAAAVGLFEARARFCDEVKNVFLRSATFQGKRYLDLCNRDWQVVEISQSGWKISSDPPIRFHRLRGMQSLPNPRAGGNIEKLRPFLGKISDDGFVLVVGFLLAALNGSSPYPILIISGEQGSAKSTATSFVRKLVDPTSDLLSSLPATQPELSRAILNNRVLALNNLSSLSGRQSDLLCQIATGGFSSPLRGAENRPCEENTRPIIMNGIVDFVRRPDLADRTFNVHLTPLSDREKKGELDLSERFQKAWPVLLGALLDAMVGGLVGLKGRRTQAGGRLVDLSNFIAGCEARLWGARKFANAYARSARLSDERLAEADPVANAVTSLVTEKLAFEGTATELLLALKQYFGGHPGSRLPAGPGALSNELSRSRPILERQGIKIAYERRGAQGTRIVKIARTGESASSSKSGSSGKIEGFTAGGRDPWPKTGRRSKPEENRTADDRQQLSLLSLCED